MAQGWGQGDIHLPKAGAGGFLLAMENRCAVAVMDGEGLFSEEGSAVGVTQLP